MKTLKEKQDREALLVQEHTKCLSEIERLRTAACQIQGYLARIREEIAEMTPKPAEAKKKR